MSADTYLEICEWLLTEGADYGLVRIGGQPTVESVLAAYRKGVFPWPATEDGVEVMAWYAPDPRAILELDGLYVSRRLARRLRSGRFRITINQDFSGFFGILTWPHDSGKGCTADRKRQPVASPP